MKNAGDLDAPVSSARDDRAIRLAALRDRISRLTATRLIPQLRHSQRQHFSADSEFLHDELVWNGVVATSVGPGSNGVLFCSKMNPVLLWLIMTLVCVWQRQERDLSKHVFVSVIVLVGISDGVEGIHLQGRTSLHLVQGNLTAVKCRDEIVQSFVMPTLRAMGQNAILQDDNATLHRAHVVLDFLRPGHQPDGLASSISRPTVHREPYG